MLETMRERARTALTSSSKDIVIDLLFLGLIIWLAHFWHFRGFGLYEDDYSHTSPALGWSFSELIVHIVAALRAYDLGRPLGTVLGELLAFVGGRLGGLGAMYLIAYLIQLGNACLFYFLLRRVGQTRVAGIGALAFGLFPADTTHIFLMHAFGLHTSLTFLLLAGHAYIRGKRALAHVLSAACLLIYESPYMVFVAIPLLSRPWDKNLLREMRRHIPIWLSILVTAVAIRAIVGEGRIEAVGSNFANVTTISREILAASVIGPAVSLSMFWRGPIWTYFHWNNELTHIFWVALLLCVWLLIRAPKLTGEQGTADTFDVRLRVSSGRKNSWLRVPRPQNVKLLLTGLVALSLAYGFSFTHFPPTATYGRDTSVHLAAAFGAALVFAWVSSIFVSTGASHVLRVAGVLVLSVYLSFLIAYRFSIQQDFKRAWQIERHFWTSVAARAPDMTDGTMIMVLDGRPPETRFIFASSWANPLVMEQIFRFPPHWKTPPRVWVVQPDWSASLQTKGDQVVWTVPPATWPAHEEALPQWNTILLEYKGRKLIREEEALSVGNKRLELRPPVRHAQPGWPKGALYPLLIVGGQ